MTLETRLTDLVSRVGGEVKDLRAKVAPVARAGYDGARGDLLVRGGKVTGQWTPAMVELGYAKTATLADNELGQGSTDVANRGYVQGSVGAAKAATLASAKAYTDGLVGNQVDVMATKNVLAGSASMPGAVVSGGTAFNLKPNFGSNFTIFTAPFPMKVVSMALVQSITTLAADGKNYMWADWRKLAADGSTFSTVASRDTKTVSWEPHIPFTFDNMTQNEAAKTLQVGESINLRFNVAGTGVYQFPIYATFRYVPL